MVFCNILIFACFLIYFRKRTKTLFFYRFSATFLLPEDAVALSTFPTPTPPQESYQGSGKEFTILSWNVLATEFTDAFSKFHRNRAANKLESQLQNIERKKLAYTELLNSNADILLLQVSLSLFQ